MYLTGTVFIFFLLFLYFNLTEQNSSPNFFVLFNVTMKAF